MQFARSPLSAPSSIEPHPLCTREPYARRKPYAHMPSSREPHARLARHLPPPLRAPHHHGPRRPRLPL
jgi:hypothetical protein